MIPIIIAMPIPVCECCRAKPACIEFAVGLETADLCNSCARLVWEASVKFYGSFPEQTELQLGRNLGVN